VVWPPEPCAEEIPEPPENPELSDDPELAEAPKPSSDPREPDDPDEVPELLELLDAALPEEPVVLACDDPGRAKATTPAAARPAAPIPAVMARTRARPRLRAAAAATGFGCCEFIGFPSSYSPAVCGAGVGESS
jgi:hypothetical protein